MAALIVSIGIARVPGFASLPDVATHTDLPGWATT
jgi:hypothetical protein